MLDHTSVAGRFVLGLAILACGCAGRRRGGENVARSRFEYIPPTSPPRRDCYASVSGLRRLSTPYFAAGIGSETRDFTCGACLSWFAYHLRACYHPTSSRLMFIIAYSNVPEVVDRAYRPRRLQDFAPLWVGRLSALVVVRAFCKSPATAGFCPPAGRALIGPGSRPGFL